MIVIVMGVSGSGKTVVGEALARALGGAFLEGDALHPAANVAKMHAGHPLDDVDRAPWLDAIATHLAAARAAGGTLVVACSALKRRYRDRLRQAAPDARFVLLDPPAATLRDRLGHREGHFMPPGLLDSQLATLERPDADEQAIVVTDAGPIASVVAQVRARLGAD